MTVTECREAYRKVAEGVGLSPAQLSDLARERLGEDQARVATPQEWLDAGRRAAQALAAQRAASGRYVALPEEQANAAQLGAIVSWTLPDSLPVEALQQAVRDAGLPDWIVPEDPTPAQRLARAAATLGARRALVRPLARGEDGGRRGGRAIVDEHVTDSGERLEHDQRLGAWVERVGAKDARHTILQVRPIGHPDEAKLRERYEAARWTYDGDQLSDWLVNTVRRLDGLVWREHGGTYWIPPTTHAQWLQLQPVLAAHGVKIAEIPCLRAATAISTLLRAATEEAEATVRRVAGEVRATADHALSGEADKQDLGRRALKARHTALNAARTRLARYEAILGAAGSAVHAALDAVQAAVASAALASEAPKQEQAAAWRSALERVADEF